MSLNRARQLQLLQHQVASAALSGVSADEIERSLIAPSNCAEEDKEALWVYAFSFLPRFEQRRIALDRLCAAVAHDDAIPRSGPRLAVPRALTDGEAGNVRSSGREEHPQASGSPSEGADLTTS